MAAYLISEVEMLDETQGRRYRELAASSIARPGSADVQPCRWKTMPLSLRS
jgi:uncharacterized protein (DUF1330 family)